MLIYVFGGITCAEDNLTPNPELSTILMQSTFRIHGPKKGDSNAISFGTAFLMGKPVPEDSTRQYYVLITTAHVLEGIEGQQATLTAAKKQRWKLYS
jgi:hypothetical protein